MPQEYLYRDPRRPGAVSGPLSLDQLRAVVLEGRLKASDQVSLDGQSWIAATEFEPELFPAGYAEKWPATAAWQRTGSKIVHRFKAAFWTAWGHVRTVAEFYWAQRRDFRQLATEYVSFLKHPGGRREIRVAAADANEAIFLDADQWHANLPDCCVVCGESAECDWNSEQRSVLDLTWPMLCPVYGFVLGVIGWIFLWNSWGRWLVPLGLFAGFLLGYRQRREALVSVRFKRCREHLNRTRIPGLRLFRKVLIVGVGDRQVWRKFYYGDREIETPTSVVPPDYSSIVASKRAESDAASEGPSYPTIPLVGDEPDDPSERRSL